MEVKIELLEKLLKILAQVPNKSYNLEELTMDVTPNDLLNHDISSEREYQAQVLNALLSLENDGMIELNSDTDESSITLKGLRRVGIDNFVS
ncbi:hypothetical protein [Flavobacterium pectinovorum]|uniref:Uncharacterized protein n=2 Tax=Flavobacterium pectinovorum TaxID=29533 RepID=A0AB36NYS3_9FLAO|nr:hypothetical protein [Flavobacterium pectinovorum]OXB03714.1 hypothetical protein B0A72_14510 [Flavobacterium pectinovorum]SHL64307.1 hypothetical protein SAMN05444387_1133 [Flavobacterium pectinovorum]